MAREGGETPLPRPRATPALHLPEPGERTGERWPACRALGLPGSYMGLGGDRASDSGYRVRGLSRLQWELGSEPPREHAMETSPLPPPHTPLSLSTRAGGGGLEGTGKREEARNEPEIGCGLKC